jgi:hypothetical protein
MFSEIITCVPDSDSKSLLEQSYNASLAAVEAQSRDNHVVASLNGEIVSESESDSAVPSSITSSEVKMRITKKRKNLLQKFRRKKARMIAEKHFLSRSISKRKNTILDRFPDIGSEIDSFVCSCDIGADM